MSNWALDATHKQYTDFKNYRKVSLVKARKMHTDFLVDTLEGVMSGKKGDFLCEGVDGERWPIKKEIFEKSYEKVVGGHVKHKPKRAVFSGDKDK